jgi:hypothetical protein
MRVIFTAEGGDEVLESFANMLNKRSKSSGALSGAY